MAEKKQKKMSRKELKAPDDFQKVGSQISAWVQARRTAAVVLGVLVLGGGVVAGVISRISHRREEKASQSLGKALEVLSRKVGTAAEKGPDADKPFATQKDKDAAIIQGLLAVRKKFPTTAAAHTAALPLGEAQLRQGQYDAALASFQDFLAHGLTSDPLRAAALEGEGYAYEGKHQLDQAMAAFKQLSEDDQTEFLNGMGLFHQARILILQHQEAAAAKILAQIPVQFPRSEAARMASKRMAVLASHGVKVPEPKPLAKIKADRGA